VTVTNDRPVEHMDPSTRFVRSLDGEYFMLREAAEMLGVSHRTLRIYLADPETKDELGPSFCAYFGKVKIYLYTREDIEKIRKYLTSRKTVFRTNETPRPTGRPPKWTSKQRKERQRLYSSAHYYSRRAEELDQTDPEAAALARAKVAAIKKKLMEQK
jgi:hypothetical protein